jgi:hypothetical protein
VDLTCEERGSDSPLVERVWYSRSFEGCSFISIAQSHWELVVSRYQGQVSVTIRGPETKATPAYCPPDAEFFGIQFKPGAFMPDLPPTLVTDRRDINLPTEADHRMWLACATWEIPDFDNADTFVHRLVRDEVLIHDPVVSAALEGTPVPYSARTVQRRVLQATGLTHNGLQQITRARYALALLKEGTSILDTVYQAGYADQPHLTRALRHFIGQTPAQIVNTSRAEKLSFLFQTTPN